MSIEAVVRAARAEDKPAVIAFCQNTFSWGDYITETWDRWLADVEGQMLVGLVEDKPVALVHVAFLGDGVAWMEGMRVHPDFRKRGVGSTLNAQACQVALERGCQVARLVTSIKNIAAQSLLGRQGYQRTAQFNEWVAEPLRKKILHVRVGNPGDAANILTMWNASIARAACDLLPDRHWHWSPLSESRTRQFIQAGELRLMDRGFCTLLAFDESDWNGLSLHALSGDVSTMQELALAARGETYYRGYEHTEAQLIDHHGINAALENAGYRREGGLFLYEQRLK